MKKFLAAAALLACCSLCACESDGRASMDQQASAKVSGCSEHNGQVCTEGEAKATKAHGECGEAKSGACGEAKSGAMKSDCCNNDAVAEAKKAAKGEGCCGACKK